MEKNKTSWHGVLDDKEKSLIEHGLLIRYDQSKKQYQCLYKTNINKYGVSLISESIINQTIFEDWFDIMSFQSYINKPLSHWIKESFITKLQDILNFLGPLDTFGITDQIINAKEAFKLARVPFSPEYCYC